MLGLISIAANLQYIREAVKQTDTGVAQESHVSGEKCNCVSVLNGDC